MSVDEIVYRRCCVNEADSSLSNRGLVTGSKAISIHGLHHSSDRDKWINRNPKWTKSYQPDGAKEDLYEIVVSYSLAPGTLGCLELEKMEGGVKRGPRGAYGIPPELIGWFNRRVIGVEAQHIDNFTPPRGISIGDDEHSHLRKPNGTTALFMAAPATLINEKSFSDQLNRKRMTWLKTSLLWTLYRSGWGTFESQDRILEIDVPFSYIHGLYEQSRPTKGSTDNDTILLARDPDRRIIGRRWNAYENEPERFFVRAGTTTHFGLRGEALGYFADQIARGNIQDITPVVESVRQKKVEHPTRELYRLLDVNISLFNVSPYTTRGKF